MIDECLETQRLRHVNDLRRQGKRKVLVFQNVVRSPGASVECFVKVLVFGGKKPPRGSSL